MEDDVELDEVESDMFDKVRHVRQSQQSHARARAKAKQRLTLCARSIFIRIGASEGHSKTSIYKELDRESD